MQGKLNEHKTMVNLVIDDKHTTASHIGNVYTIIGWETKKIEKVNILTKQKVDVEIRVPILLLREHYYTHLGTILDDESG